MRRKRQRSLSSSGSEKSGPIASASSTGLGSSRRATGRLVCGSGATQLKRGRELGVARRARDRVVLALEVVDGEADADRLQVVGLMLGRRVRLAGHRPRLEAGDVLARAQRQQLAGLARVQEPVRDHHRVLAAPAQRHGGHAVALDLRRDRRVLEPQVDRRRQHRLEHRERDARLVPEPRDEARAGVELDHRARRCGEREALAVVRADAVAQRPVGRGAAVGLDPRVLVRRHGLARELPADPVGRLGQHDVEPASRRRDRGRDAAEPAADDQDVGAPLDQSRERRARPPPP